MKHLISAGDVQAEDISVVDCPYLSRPPQALVDLLTSPEGNLNIEILEEEEEEDEFESRVAAKLNYMF